MLSRHAILKLGVSAAICTALRKRVLNCLWELTYRCNARCAICSYWKEPTRPKDELTLPETQAGLKRVYSFGYRFINFTGGEPTIRRDLEEIIRSASRLGIWTSIVTNGSLLTRRRLRDLKRAGLDNCFISLDSVDSSVHDEHRGIPGLHAKVRECLRWVSEDFLRGHHTGGIMCVLSHRNLHQVADVVRLAEELAAYVVFQPYHPNKTAYTTRKPPITQETVTQLLDLEQSSSAVLSSRSYLRGMADFCQGSAAHRCQAGYKYFSVDPYGYVHPCVDTPPVGRLLRDDVSVIRSPSALRDVLSCPGCWYCFRGEADCMLSMRGYFEKLHAACSVVLRNTLRDLRRRRSHGSFAGLEETDRLPQPDLFPAHGMARRPSF